MNDAAKRRAPDPATRRPRSKSAPEIVEAKGADAARYPWTRAFRASKIPLATKGLVFALASYGNADGSSNHPGIARLTRELGCDEKTVRRHLAVAERAGWLRRTHEGRVGMSRQDADDYQLTVPDATGSRYEAASDEEPEWLDEVPDDDADRWTNLSTNQAADEMSSERDQWTNLTRPVDKFVQTPRTTPTKENQVLASVAGVASATPIGSHSDQGGITADAATEPRGDRSRRESKKTRGEPVTPERRSECNDYIALLKQLDEEDVFDAIEELWDSKWEMWIWAYNLMAKAHGLPRVARDDYEYHEPDTPEQAEMVYVKALRLSSKNVEWELILTGPLDELAFKNRHQPPACAA